MLSDHENLLSTFGKDSQQSSNRKSKDIMLAKNILSQKVSLIYDRQPKSKYQQILSRRETLMMLQKQEKNLNKGEQANSINSYNSKNKAPKLNKKLKTESDIDYLNICIRKSISNITETICKSKGKTEKTAGQNVNNSQINKPNPSKVNSTFQQAKIKQIDSQKRRPSLQNDKQNLDINGQRHQLAKYPQYLQKIANYEINRNEYLKNSTKKKGPFLQRQNPCQIRSSFSIDLNNSQRSSQSFESSQNSRAILNHKNVDYPLNSDFSVFDLKSSKTDKYQGVFKKHYPDVRMCEVMENTLKKELKKFSLQNQIQQKPALLETKGVRHQKKKEDFFFYEDMDCQYKNTKKISHFQEDQFQRKKSRISTQISQKLTSSFSHPLIQAFVKQIQLDFDLRHAKHMFSGIEQPFYTYPALGKQSQSKWQKLNIELEAIGLFYPVQTIKKIFLPTQEEIDPFLSAPKPHQELTYSLIYAYETAQIHWQKTIYQKWQHWDLRDIDLTIQNIDRDRKGYVTVEDIAAFISMQTGKQYKNRDVVLIYKRMVNGFHSVNLKENSKNQKQYLEQKERLKFRCLIDCLIKPFINIQTQCKRR